MKNNFALPALAALAVAACGGGGGSDSAPATAPSPAPVVPAPAPVAAPEGLYAGPTVAAPSAGGSGVPAFSTASILIDGRSMVWASYQGPNNLPNFFFYSISDVGVQEFTGLGEWFRPGSGVSAFARQYVLGVGQDAFGNWVLKGDQITIRGSFVERQSISAPPVATAQFSAGFPFNTLFDVTPLVVASRSYTASITVPGYFSVSSVPISVSGATFSGDIGTCHISGTLTPTSKNYNYVSTTIGSGCGIPGNPQTLDGVVTPGSGDKGIAGEDATSTSLLMMAKNSAIKVVLEMR